MVSTPPEGRQGFWEKGEVRGTGLCVGECSSLAPSAPTLGRPLLFLHLTALSFSFHFC